MNTILLVEDNPTDAKVMRDFMSPEKDSYEMHWVQDGAQALDFLLKRGTYQDAPDCDLILLDLALPRLSGYEVLRLLKHQFSTHSDVGIIVLTTSENPVDRKACMQFGADAFYSKPFTLKEYEKLVQTLIKGEFPRLLEARKH